MTAAALSPGSVWAQQKAMPVIGYLTATSLVPALLDKFRKGLAEQGYVEGRNVTIEFRAAEGKYDRLPAMAAELVGRRVDVLVTAGGNVAAHAGKAATGTVPIVFLGGGDPVAGRLVDSLARPGANITGVAQLNTASETKRLELLRQLKPPCRSHSLRCSTHRLRRQRWEALCALLPCRTRLAPRQWLGRLFHQSRLQPRSGPLRTISIARQSAARPPPVFFS